MRKQKMRKKLISVFLVLSIMLSLAVPVDISVFAEEPARGSDIHAFLYYIDPEKKLSNGDVDITLNLELVFQRGDTADPNKTVFRHFTDFADVTNKPQGYVNPWYCSDTSNTSSTNYHGNITIIDV